MDDLLGSVLPMPPIDALALCSSQALADGGLAVLFDLCYYGKSASAFAIRHQGLALAYLNRCAHVGIELDWQPGRFFDDQGQWLLCAAHGAAYHPHTGVCVSGPCFGAGLTPVPLLERDGWIYWLPAHPFQPLTF